MRTLLLFLLAGCIGDLDPDAVEDVFVQGDNPLVDVLFVVVDSSSLAEIQTGLASAAGSLLDAMGTSDWQIGVTTTDFEDPDRRGRLVETPAGVILDANTGSVVDRLAFAIAVGTEGAAQQKGLQSAWAAVTPPLLTHENLGLRRDEARLAIVIVSDGDDCSDDGALGDTNPDACNLRPELLVPTSDYRSRFADLGDVTVHAVVEPGNGEAGCGLGSPGTRYVSVARATGGSVVAPCGAWGEIAAALGAELSGQRRGFPLQVVPQPETLVVSIEGADGTTTEVDEDPNREDGWSFDAAANAVFLHGSVSAPLGATVRIAYSAAAS